MAQSLRDRYPRRIEVPLLILASFVLLLIALSLPLLTVEKMVLWKNEYSVIAGVHGLWEQGQYALAIILFFFSIVFPLFKLAMLGFIWFIRLAERKRQAVLHWLGILGKWSMLDVFVVAILIVLVKLGPLAKVQPQPGVYWFAAAIFLSMITSMYVDSLAQKQT
ncbi:MAG: paraquat-inducible protein A [Verrucomicrobiia bacterium]